MSIQYWFMFPVAILVATIAMASGIGGATFFAPILMVILRLPPEVAIGTGIMTQFFGFSSGVYAFHRKKLIDYQLGGSLLIFSIPLALVGTWLSTRIDPETLKFVLGVGLILISVQFLRVPSHEGTNHTVHRTRPGRLSEEPKCIVTAEGEEICYQVDNYMEGRIVAGIGSLFMGMVSTGLGELNAYYLLRRCNMPSKIAVATNVFILAVTSLIASTGHILKLIQLGNASLSVVVSLLMFTIPGVILGGQIGPVVASRIPQRLLETALGILFLTVGLLMSVGTLL
jgi:uncharacterized protein